MPILSVGILSCETCLPLFLKFDLNWGMFRSSLILYIVRKMSWLICALIRLKKKKKKRILCLKAAACVCFSVHVWFIKIQGLIFFFFFLLAYFFPHIFMNLLVKIYKKRYDRHNETLWTTDFFNCVVSCILFIQKSSSKAVTDLNLTHLLLRKKKKKKKNAFRSGLLICHELWDITFIFFSLRTKLSWNCEAFLYPCVLSSLYFS